MDEPMARVPTVQWGIFTGPYVPGSWCSNRCGWAMCLICFSMWIVSGGVLQMAVELSLPTLRGGMASVRSGPDIIQSYRVGFSYSNWLLYFGLQACCGWQAMQAVAAAHLTLPSRAFGDLFALLSLLLWRLCWRNIWCRPPAAFIDWRKAVKMLFVEFFIKWFISIPFFCCDGYIGLVALAIANLSLDANFSDAICHFSRPSLHYAGYCAAAIGLDHVCLLQIRF